jgi:hypothetical protein
MFNRHVVSVLFAATVPFLVLAGPGANSQAPTVAIPKPGVPQIMTIEGAYVRVAYNNEGYISLGYRTANQSIGEEWMLLEVGATMRDGKPNFKLTRDAISLDVPDGKRIPLPTNSEYRAADVRALEQRSTVVRDSINYFPPGASSGCRIGFFAPLESRSMAYDEVELSWQRGCLGRLFFKIPGGIQYGQHWLNVQFKESLVRVPFRILTEAEQKTMSKHYGDIRKQVQAAFKKK